VDTAERSLARWTEQGRGSPRNPHRGLPHEVDVLLLGRTFDGLIE